MKVAFLDRDGVINQDFGYVYQSHEFVLTDRCVEGLKVLQAQGFTLMVVTNQSGIGRGYYTETQYQQLTRWYRTWLLEQGVTLTAVFHCPHKPDDHCACRKPQSGLFLQAAAAYDIDFTQSLMVGDKLSDLQAAAGVGITELIFINEQPLSPQAVMDHGLAAPIRQVPSLFAFTQQAFADERSSA